MHALCTTCCSVLRRALSIKPTDLVYYTNLHAHKFGMPPCIFVLVACGQCMEGIKMGAVCPVQCYGGFTIVYT